MPEPRRILVVDDDKLYAQMLRTFLEGEGFKVAAAYAGANVTETVKKGCDLVLLDLYMGGETGMDLLIALRHAFPALPVVIMSGMASSELKQTAENLGACAFLKKPFPMSALKKTVEGFLGATPPPRAPSA